MEKIIPKNYFLRKFQGWMAVALLCAALSSLACAENNRPKWLSLDRDLWQHPDQVIQSLGIQPGDRVADVGSGEGYFTFRLSKAVGQNGKVYAVDIDEDRNQYVENKAREEGYKNIEIIVPKVHDPLLPESGVNMIFTSNTYHHLEDRTHYFLNAKKYLRPNGRVVVIDFRKGAFRHFTERRVVLDELQAAGYELEKEHTFLPQQNFLVFSAPSK